MLVWKFCVKAQSPHRFGRFTSKLYLSTKFPHQEIRWNNSILCSYYSEVSKFILVLLKHKTPEISQQWQCGHLNFSKGVSKNSSSGTQTFARHYSFKGKTVNLASSHNFTRDVNRYKNTLISQLYQPAITYFWQNIYH